MYWQFLQSSETLPWSFNISKNATGLLLSGCVTILGQHRLPGWVPTEEPHQEDVRKERAWHSDANLMSKSIVEGAPKIWVS